MNEIIKSKIGRPTILTEETIAKLESVFKLDVTNEVACDYAEIDPATLYRHVTTDESFARRIRTAKQYARLKAADVVMNAITEDKDVISARWWLERRYPAEFSQTPNINLNVGQFYIELPEREAEVVDTPPQTEASS